MIIQPFDYNPIRVETKNSSNGVVQIPVGEYAMISANVRAGGIFKINGINAMNAVGVGGSHYEAGVAGGGGSTHNVATAPEGFFGTVDCQITGGSNSWRFEILRAATGIVDTIISGTGVSTVSAQDFMSEGDIARIWRSHVSDTIYGTCGSIFSESASQIFWLKQQTTMEIVGNGSFTIQSYKIAT